jgi:exodeoxyribonuclease-5
MKLTEEQKYVTKELLRFKKTVQKLSGYAGCGKTTVIKHLHSFLPYFAVCAYTGKATNVLRKKGIESATTIHNLIYKPHEDSNGDVYFTLANDIACEGVIIDEASMVGKEIFQDLRSFNKPLIFVGDHGQLEPISEKSFNLMEYPDYKLETIHRNAGEIAHFSNYIRNGYKPSSWQHKNGHSDKIKFINKSGYKELLTEVDQVICAFNKTRANVNIETREKLGRIQTFPAIGDKIVCLRNNAKKSLFNGMQGFIGWFHTKDYIQFVSDVCIDIKIDLKHFNNIKYDLDWSNYCGSDGPNPFDYAYAVTCHKAQADEFDKVLVLEQRCDLWTHSKWTYTAASRAKEKLYWCEF